MRSKHVAFVMAILVIGAMSASGQQQIPIPGQAATARFIGMGGAQVAVADDAYAAASNPAGLARLRVSFANEDTSRQRFFGSRRVETDDSEITGTGGVHGGLPQAGLAYATSENDGENGYGAVGDLMISQVAVQPTTFIWSLGYGGEFGDADELGWGAAIDGVQQAGLNVVGLRVGLLWTSEQDEDEFDEGVSLGLTLGYDSRQALYFRGGAAIRAGDNSLIAGDISYAQGWAQAGWNIGAEVEVGDDWALRIGSNNAYGTGPASFSTGIGYVSESDWRVDVGYEYRPGAGNTLLFGAGTQF